MHTSPLTELHSQKPLPLYKYQHHKLALLLEIVFYRQCFILIDYSRVISPNDMLNNAYRIYTNKFIGLFFLIFCLAA